MRSERLVFRWREEGLETGYPRYAEDKGRSRTRRHKL